MSAVIEVEALRKEYQRVRGGTTVAVNGLDLSVPEGGVFGFLGPNGSGKTTTIRCLLGLVRPSSGRARMLGAEMPTALPSVIGRVGSIVETPAMFPTMSGRRNLLLLGQLEGIGPKAVDAALERVGLAERSGDLVRNYSLGMRQRLGLAAALLKDPALLILDEPANGLDPAGIKEIRGLVRSLGAEGRTVFVSSHLLSEIEQTCDRVAILSRGRCVAAGPVAEVLRGNRAAGMLARVAHPRAALRVLKQAGLTATREGELLVVDIDAGQAARVAQVLGEGGHWVSDLRPREVSLEDVFLDLTEERS
jgi:ABC-2 type transport system ATP-binding protein